MDPSFFMPRGIIKATMCAPICLITIIAYFVFFRLNCMVVLIMFLGDILK